MRVSTAVAALVVLALIAFVMYGCSMPNNSSADNKPIARSKSIVIINATGSNKIDMDYVVNRVSSYYPGLVVLLDPLAISDYRLCIDPGVADTNTDNRVGLAWTNRGYAEVYVGTLATMCEDVGQRDIDIAVANVVIHETGHLLGADHDDSFSGCLALHAAEYYVCWIECQ